MLQSMAKRVQNPGARKFIESEIKAERSNLAAVAKRSRDAAAAEELRGLANEALQAGDAATHSALTAQAEKLAAPAAAEAEATHARAAAQQIIDAGNAPGAGQLARAVGAGMSRALATAGTQKGASNVLSTSAEAHGRAIGNGRPGQDRDSDVVGKRVSVTVSLGS